MSSSARYLLSSPEGERSFQDARRLFEAAAARNAAELATPEEIQHLKDTLAANRNAIGSLEDFERTDVEFQNAPYLFNLYKIYSDDAAFNERLKSDHYRTFSAAGDTNFEGKTVRLGILVSEANRPQEKPRKP